MSNDIFATVSGSANWQVVPAMPTAKYFRRQLDVCLRLSLIASSKEEADRLVAIAKDYKRRADEFEALEAKSKSRLQECSPARVTHVGPTQRSMVRRKSNAATTNAFGIAIDNGYCRQL